MLEQLQDRYGRMPSWYLADGGFRQFADIDWAWSHDTASVIPAQGRDGKDPYAPRPGDGPGVAVWRELMSGALGQRMYRIRSQLEACSPRCTSVISVRSWFGAATRCAALCCCTRSLTICYVPPEPRRLSPILDRSIPPGSVILGRSPDPSISAAVRRRSSLTMPRGP